MTYRVPHLAWERARRIAPRDGRPAVEVPAELSALSPAARALLTTRLAWRCGAHRVLLGPGPEPAITFVGLELETFDTPARAVVDEALATVERDAAAGWTPADEDERHAPLDWT